MRFEVDGKPIFEELFGREGFSGPSSLIYHRHMPEAAHDISEGPADLMAHEREQVHEHAHLQGFNLQPDGDVISGRKWLLVNDDVHIGLAFPIRQQEVLCVNGSADEILFVHRGAGTLHTQFGSLLFGPHDYVVIPRGTIYRIEFDSLDDVRILAVEVTGLVDSPDRYRARNGQLTEIAPYSERDFRGPEALEAGGDGPAEVWLKRAGRVTRYHLDHHPFDVVGWDGTIYPVAFNIHDFEPRAGRFHVPPPIHQTFQAHHVVICSFVPRKLDWDPDAVMLPYHHSNLDSDEVLYYVDGDYAARRGVQRSHRRRSRGPHRSRGCCGGMEASQRLDPSPACGARTSRSPRGVPGKSGGSAGARGSAPRAARSRGC